MSGDAAGWTFVEEPRGDPVAEAAEGGSPYAEAMRRAADALERRWAEERPEEPEREMRFTVTMHCTFSTFESVKLALKGFGIREKWFRQEEIPPGRQAPTRREREEGG